MPAATYIYDSVRNNNFYGTCFLLRKVTKKPTELGRAAINVSNTKKCPIHCKKVFNSNVPLLMYFNAPLWYAAAKCRGMLQTSSLLASISVSFKALC